MFDNGDKFEFLILKSIISFFFEKKEKAPIQF